MEMTGKGKQTDVKDEGTGAGGQCISNPTGTIIKQAFGGGKQETEKPGKANPTDEE
jgi:hypothetical protein